MVAATIDNMPIGMLVGSFTSISLDPPLVGFFGDLGSSTFPRLLERTSLAISVLPYESRAVCEAFRLPVECRFDAVSWSRTPRGNPVLDEALVVIDGPVVDTHAVGDHVLVTTAAETVRAVSSAAPLMFHGRRFHRLDPACVGTGDLDCLAWRF